MDGPDARPPIALGEYLETPFKVVKSLSVIDPRSLEKNGRLRHKAAHYHEGVCLMSPVRGLKSLSAYFKNTF